MKNYVLKITLRNSDISRTVAIPADYGFFDLHDVIAITFGWEDYFYHQFNAGGTVIVDDANEDIDLLPDRFKYEYEVRPPLLPRGAGPAGAGADGPGGGQLDGVPAGPAGAHAPAQASAGPVRVYGGAGG